MLLFATLISFRYFMVRRHFRCRLFRYCRLALLYLAFQPDICLASVYLLRLMHAIAFIASYFRQPFFFFRICLLC